METATAKNDWVKKLNAKLKMTHADSEKKRAIFLDRDGTINVELPGYVTSVEQFRFLPGAIEAMRLLAKTDYKIIIVTNQGGVAKGLYTEKDLDRIHHRMISELKDHGVEIHKVCYCPHHGKGTVKEFSIACECKKPGIKLYREAAEEFGIDLSKSWVVGDRETDIAAGHKLGCKTILVKSGMENEEFYSNVKPQADYVVDNLLLATHIILEEDNSHTQDQGGC